MAEIKRDFAPSVPVFRRFSFDTPLLLNSRSEVSCAALSRECVLDECAPADMRANRAGCFGKVSAHGPNTADSRQTEKTVDVHLVEGDQTGPLPRIKKCIGLSRETVDTSLF